MEVRQALGKFREVFLAEKNAKTAAYLYCAQQKSAGLLKNEFDKTQKFCPNNIV